MIKKIITHDEKFHADELFAIALIIEAIAKQDIPVERSRKISKQDLDDPDVWIVDAGLKYDVNAHNFDHHQDKTGKKLPASNMLVFNYATESNLISQDLAKELKKSFITISTIDINGYRDMSGFQVNSLIATFNSLENGFKQALSVARAYVQACIREADNAVVSRQIWAERKVVAPMIAYVESFPVKWKTYGNEKFLIQKAEDKFKLHSCDSEKYPLVSTGREEYFHHSRHFAIYQSYKDAENAAEVSARLLSLGK